MTIVLDSTDVRMVRLVARPPLPCWGMAGTEQDMKDSLTLRAPRPYMRVTDAKPKPVTGLTIEQKVLTAVSVPLAALAGVGIGHCIAVLVGLA